MLIKIYWSTWALFALAVLVLFATGNLTMIAWSALGFFAFGLTFMGMMAVLPVMITHPASPKPVEAQKRVELQPIRETPAQAFHIFKSA